MRKIRQFLLTTAVVLSSALTLWAESYTGVSQEPVTITASNYTDYGFTADNWKLFKDYYGIRNAAELYGFAELVNGGKPKIKGVLTADIEINENVLKSDGERNEDVSNFKQWTPIGTFSKKFEGTFDGNGHYIKGLYFNNPDRNNFYPTGGSCVGLFGAISSAKIQNVGLVDNYINGGDYVGGFCGYASGGTITNCYNNGRIIGSFEVGGICGGWSTITNCYNTGKISGGSEIGGICGREGYQINCYNTGNVTDRSSSHDVGGICGYVPRGSVGESFQINCYCLEGCALKTGGGISVTTEDFESGKVAFMLNNRMYDKTVAWYQNLETEKDALPVLNNNHGKVYPSIPCATSFSNTPDIASQPHVFGEGLTCTVCGNYDKPSQASDGTYQISNASQLYWFATSVNNGNVGINGSLEADIQINRNVLDDQGNLNGSGDDFEMWIPIGTGTNQYKGIFDGKGHTINGLFFKNTVNKNYPYGGYYVGLFGYVGGAKIKNVGLVDSYIQGSYSVGGICGSEARYTHSQIINCYNTGTIKGSYYIGGICGLYCEQHNCYNAGIVSGEQSVGGICGYSSELVKHCYNIGKVSITGDGAEVGGICVYAGKVDGCYCLEDCAPSAGGGFFATSEDFASGKITYLLNGCETNENNVWYQKLGATPDAFPVLDKNHGRVYASEPCLIMFGNSPVESIAHVYEDGQCTVCGEYEPATIVDGVYQIARPSDLYWFASYVNKGNTNINGILTADIIVNVGVLNDDGDLNSASSDFKNWTPIGTSSVIYGGVFDGNGHIISGLYFNNGSENMVGLFGYANGATIKNVGVVDSYFKGYEYVGGICGYSYSTKTNITNCYNAGTIVGNSRYIGGICGYCYTGRTIITNCYNLGKIDGNHERVGGISGDGGNLKNCFNAGTVKGKNYYTGGICGAGGEQTNCYNIGDVFGDINVGGICGYYGDQTNCYNVGNVTGTSYGVGGISGVYGTAVNCYYLAGCAKVGDDVEQYGIGCEEVGQALEDEEGTVSATNYDFKSGKIGFLLNGGANAENIEWYQTIGTDAFPVLNNNHDVIYASAPCPFSNNESGIAEHKFDTLEFLAPTCTEAGFSGNLLCKICGYYEQGYSIDALGHAYDTVAVAATCTADGYKELTCSRCNHVEHIDAVPAEGHKPAAAVFENVVAATCTAVGSYDSVVYCTVCKTELSRDKKTVSAAGHKADSVAFENVVEATRTTAGSYDSVVYCSVCKAELSRTTIEVPQIVAETIKLTSKPNKVDYKQGETLDVKGGKIAIGYSDKSTEEFEILAGWVSGFDSQKVGEQKLTVTFESVSSTLTTTFNVTVSKEDDNTNNTAIDEDAANVVNIYAYKNTIVVENATDDILVYNTMGALICRDAMHCVRKEIIISTPGVYIVKTGNTAKRVMVY